MCWMLATSEMGQSCLDQEEINIGWVRKGSRSKMGQY